jgi:hypothetical protein
MAVNRNHAKGGVIVMGKLIKFLESIALSLVKDIIKSVLILVFTSGIFGFAAHFISANLLLLSQYSVWAGMVFASGAGLISLYIYSRFSERIPKFRNMDFQYKVLLKEYSYEYMSKTNMKFKKYIKIKSLVNNLDRLHDRFCWSGCGNITTRTLNKDFLYTPTVRRGVYQEYDILFDRKLKKGEILEVCVCFDMEDIYGTADPHMSTTISAPTDHLILRVIVPKQFGIEKAIAEVLPNSDYYNPFETQMIDFVYNESYGEAKWEKYKPSLLHIYSMRWKF